jgi:hypothetical protein
VMDTSLNQHVTCCKYLFLKYVFKEYDLTMQYLKICILWLQLQKTWLYVHELAFMIMSMSMIGWYLNYKSKSPTCGKCDCEHNHGYSYKLIFSM